MSEPKCGTLCITLVLIAEELERAVCEDGM